MSYEKDCFVCGTDNKRGLKLKYYCNANNDYCYADFIPKKYCQSYDGVFHGGLQCAIMDSAMVYALKVKKIIAVTVKMAIKFKKTVDNQKPLRVEARICDSKYKRGFYKLTSKIIQNCDLKTECCAVFKKI